MYFSEYIMTHKERVFEMAEQNAACNEATATLYEEWQSSEDEAIMNFYN